MTYIFFEKKKQALWNKTNICFSQAMAPLELLANTGNGYFRRLEISSINQFVQDISLKAMASLWVISIQSVFFSFLLIDFFCFQEARLFYLYFVAVFVIAVIYPQWIQMTSKVYVQKQYSATSFSLYFVIFLGFYEPAVETRLPELKLCGC